MKNMKLSVVGDKLTIEVDLKGDMGVSSTGKSRMVASSEGPTQIPDSDVRINLNVYRKL